MMIIIIINNNKNNNNDNNNNNNNNRLYVGRKDGGRGLISIEECVENSMLGLREYVEHSNERLIRAAKDWYEVSEESVDDLKRRRAAERKERWKEKANAWTVHKANNGYSR